MIECKFEKGDIAQLRHAVVDAVIIDKNKILLTKRADKLRENGKWSLPGGFVEHGETTSEAVMREVLEEVGYTSVVEDLLTIIDKPNRKSDDRQNISFAFVIKLIKKVSEPDSEEVSEVKWFDINKLPSEKEIAFDHLEIIWHYIDQVEELT
ncbi:MAG: NUDIX hydrolase [bacterium]|nr:NUDIX hydrolase [bacterium]